MYSKWEVLLVTDKIIIFTYYNEIPIDSVGRIFKTKSFFRHVANVLSSSVNIFINTGKMKLSAHKKQF